MAPLAKKFKQSPFEFKAAGISYQEVFIKSDQLYFSPEEIPKEKIYEKYFLPEVRSRILRTRGINYLYYSTSYGDKRAIYFVEMIIENMILKIKLYSYTPVKFQSQLSDKALKSQQQDLGRIKTSIKRNLMEAQLRAMEEFSILDMAQISAHILNYTSKSSPGLIRSKYFKIKLYSKIYFNDQDEKEEIENFFFNQKDKTYKKLQKDYETYKGNKIKKEVLPVRLCLLRKNHSNFFKYLKPEVLVYSDKNKFEKFEQIKTEGEIENDYYNFDMIYYILENKNKGDEELETRNLALPSMRLASDSELDVKFFLKRK